MTIGLWTRRRKRPSRHWDQQVREHRRDSGDATLYFNNFFYDSGGNRTRLEYNDGTGTTTTSYLYNSADQGVGGRETFSSLLIHRPTSCSVSSPLRWLGVPLHLLDGEGGTRCR